MCICATPSTGVSAQGQSWAAPDIPGFHSCSQQGITATVCLVTGNENVANIPIGLWCSPCPPAPPNLLGWKESSGHERDDKAYHYSRLWIITGLKWTEETDSTWITESIEWGSADWTLVCPVGKCSLNWLNWAKPTLHWPQSSCQATANWFYNPSNTLKQPWHRGTTGWLCPSQTSRVKIPVTVCAIWDSFLIKNNAPVRSSHKHCWC